MENIAKYTFILLIIAAGNFSGWPKIQETKAAFTKLPNPTDLPTYHAHSSSFSPNGTHLAVTHADLSSEESRRRYLIIYKRIGDTFTKLADPDICPTGNGFGTAFSPDGTYLAVAHDVSPYVTIYKRSGDTYTKLADPDILPTNVGRKVSFVTTRDGTYLAVAYKSSPYITIYKQSGDTFSKLADPDILPTGYGYGAAFSLDGTYLAVAHDVSPYVTIYKRIGDTFTKLAAPDILPTGVGLSTAFSPDMNYLVVSHDVIPNVTIYKRSGDTFTKLADPDILPTAYGYGATFNPDGTYLVIAHDQAPYVTIYYRRGDTFTKLANPDILPTNVGCGPSFTADGTYLAVGHDDYPFLAIYKVDPIHPTSANNGGGATTLVINKPVGLAVNDVMIANLSVRSEMGVTITSPSGWNLVRMSNATNLLAHATYWKTATNFEPDSYTWTFSSSHKASGGIHGYRGFNTTNPIDAEDGQINESSTSITAPSIETTVDNTVLVFGGGIAIGTKVSSYPDGLSMRFEAESTGDWTETRTTTTAGDELKETVGSTGKRTVTITGEKGAVCIGHLLALKPATAK